MGRQLKVGCFRHRFLRDGGKTENVFRDISPHVKEQFDTSNFREPHLSGIPIGVNKKVSLLMKSELAGKPILEFVALRSKMYAFTHLDGEEKRAKGVPKDVVKKSINFR